MGTKKLTDKLIKGLKINHGASVLTHSGFINEDKEHYIKTDIPILNTALSGNPDLGLSYGVTMFAGESKRFKSTYGMLLAKAFQDKYKDGIVLYLDSEQGIQNIEKYGLDSDRVVHVPIMNVEELKFNLSNVLEEWDKDDKLFIFTDSLGNLASKKEVDDSLEGKSVADMSRAKQMKSVFRIITPIINLKKIYTYFIQHVYKSQDFMPVDVVAGGTGGMLSADTVVIVGKSKEKEGKELQGFNFKLKINKSRYVKEETVFDIIATFEDGVLPYSGLSDVAVECGIIEKVKRRSNMLVFKDLEIKEKESTLKQSKPFWDRVFEESDLKECMIKKYQL